jgi:hypothetical protein
LQDCKDIDINAGKNILLWKRKIVRDRRDVVSFARSRSCTVLGAFAHVQPWTTLVEQVRPFVIQLGGNTRDGRHELGLVKCGEPFYVLLSVPRRSRFFILIIACLRPSASSSIIGWGPDPSETTEKLHLYK